MYFSFYGRDLKLKAHGLNPVSRCVLFGSYSVVNLNLLSTLKSREISWKKCRFRLLWKIWCGSHGPCFCLQQSSFIVEAPLKIFFLSWCFVSCSFFKKKEILGNFRRGRRNSAVGREGPKYEIVLFTNWRNPRVFRKDVDLPPAHAFLAGTCAVSSFLFCLICFLASGMQ